MTDINDIVDAEIVDPDEPVEKTFTSRGIAKFVVRSSVKFVIASALTSLVPEAETTIHKVKVLVGTYVVADMVAKSTGSYVDEKIDGWKKDISELRDAVKKIEAELKTQKEES